MIKEFYLKYRIFIIPAVVGLICLIITAFVIIPQVFEIFKEKEEIGVLTNRVDALNNKAKELEQLDESKLQQELITALTVLPTGRDVPQAMAALQDLISKSNLVLKNTAYSSVSKTTGQNSFSLTISVVGATESIRNFLNNIDQGSRIFKVESITLRFQPETGSASVDLPLSVFYQAAPTTVLTPDQPVAKFGPKEEELIAKLTTIASQKTAVSTVSAIETGKEDPFQ